jgi:cytoskeleton protein RodZ
MTPGFQSPNYRYKNDVDGRLAPALLCFGEPSAKHAVIGNSLGQDLRNARLRQDLELSQISSILKISKRHLRAIEDGDIGALPLGDVYLIGYTRAYADYLGLDTTQCVEKLKFEIVERDVNRQAVIVKEPQHKRGLPSAVRHILILLGLI